MAETIAATPDLSNEEREALKNRRAELQAELATIADKLRPNNEATFRASIYVEGSIFVEGEITDGGYTLEDIRKGIENDELSVAYVIGDSINGIRHIVDDDLNVVAVLSYADDDVDIDGNDFTID